MIFFRLFSNEKINTSLTVCFSCLKNLDLNLRTTFVTDLTRPLEFTSVLFFVIWPATTNETKLLKMFRF